MLTFDTELDNTVTVQKGGSWIDKQSLELKAFHNEEDGQAYSNNDSILQDFYVTWNFIYTGTPIALKKKVNEQNFGSGLATRLTCIPLPTTNFEMMTRERSVDFDSDGRLKEWAFKLDRMKGLLTLDKIVDEEISIGDYVLTGGELPAMVVADTVARMCDGVLADEVCFTDESIYSGLLEYPQYTRPEVWEGEAVPPVLLTGHHKNIENWRHEQSLKLTAERRPDLLAKFNQNAE